MNALAKGKKRRLVTVKCNATIRDNIAASCVAYKLSLMGFHVQWDCHNLVHGVMRRSPSVLAVVEHGGRPMTNLESAYERHPLRKPLHFSELYIQSANDDLAKHRINLGPATNCRPRLIVSASEKHATTSQLMRSPKLWIFLSPGSSNYVCRQLPNHIWEAAAKGIKGSCFWMGRDAAPKGSIDLGLRDLDRLTVMLSVADLMITVNTGPMQIGAALGVPIVAIGQSFSPDLELSDQCDFLTISPRLDCLNCQQNECPINRDVPPCRTIAPEIIAAWANAKLRQLDRDDVSAVIPVYKPQAHVLNRCIDSVLPQVSKVILTLQGDSVLPSGLEGHTKLRIVRKEVARLGFGRNVNFLTEWQCASPMRPGAIRCAAGRGAPFLP